MEKHWFHDLRGFDLRNSSRYLYVLAAGLQTVEAFRVETNGSLTPIGSVGGLPFAAQGIAAR